MFLTQYDFLKAFNFLQICIEECNNKIIDNKGVCVCVRTRMLWNSE